MRISEQLQKADERIRPFPPEDLRLVQGPEPPVLPAQSSARAASESTVHADPLLDPAALPEPPRQQKARRVRVSGDRRRAQAYMDKVIADLAKTPPGGRNNALNRPAWTLGHWVAAGSLEHNDIEDALYTAAVVNGLVADDGERQCWVTIRSALNKGLEEPQFQSSATLQGDCNARHPFGYAEQRDEKKEVAMLLIALAMIVGQVFVPAPPRYAVCATMFATEALYQVFTGTDASTDTSMSLCQAVGQINSWRVVDVMPNPRGNGWVRECYVQAIRKGNDDDAIANAPGVSMFYLSGQSGFNSYDPTIQTWYNASMAYDECRSWGSLGYGVGFDS